MEAAFDDPTVADLFGPLARVHGFTCSHCAVTVTYSADALQPYEAECLLFNRGWSFFYKENTVAVELMCMACRKARGLWVGLDWRRVKREKVDAKKELGRLVPLARR